MTTDANTPPRPQAHTRLRPPKRQIPRRGRAQGEEVEQGVCTRVEIAANTFASAGAPLPCPGAIGAQLSLKMFVPLKKLWGAPIPPVLVQ